MKVRMKVDVSGSRNGRPWPSRGGVVDVPNEEGAQLCSAGMATPVDDEAQPEKAVASEGENRGLTTETAPATVKKTPARPAKKTTPPAVK